MLGRIGAFIAGAAIGAGVGAVIGLLNAPQSGYEFRESLDRTIDQAKLAGLEAQVRTEEELIRRYRAETGDATALRDAETQARVGAAQAMVGLNPQ
ncbi:MAG: YtxH domain-containing protein [Thermomicrobiales bacterium]